MWCFVTALRNEDVGTVNPFWVIESIRINRVS